MLVTLGCQRFLDVDARCQFNNILIICDQNGQIRQQYLIVVTDIDVTLGYILLVKAIFQFKKFYLLGKKEGIRRNKI